MASKTIKSENSKLVIAISSRALFDLDHSHKIFKEEGIEAYARHQQDNEHVILEPGVGFTLVKKLLKLNSKKTPIDVIPVSYTHLRAHETSLHLVCRLLLEKKK